MPTDKDTALTLQRKYFGNPQGLAQHLVTICLNQIGVVREVFIILDRFSTFDVGFRFLNLLPSATLLKLANTKNGKALCELLLRWFLNPEPLNSSEAAAPGIDWSIELRRLKNAIDNSSPPDDGENPYYTIDAGINLEADAIAVLDKIGPLYYARVGEKFNVNSGTRDSWHQADAMYDVYMGGDRTLSLYNRTRANELIAIIKKGESRAATIQKMTDLIQKYFEQHIIMSDHQKAGAIDIDINGDDATGVSIMTAPQRKIMMEIATKVTGFATLLEKHPPHIHIKFKE